MKDEESKIVSMPAERPGVNQKFEILGVKEEIRCPNCGYLVEVRDTGVEGYFHVGLRKDGLPGELFITLQGTGSLLRGVFDCFGKAVSYGLKYGVPWRKYISGFSATKFEPCGIVRRCPIHPDSHQRVSSVVDLAFQWIAFRFPEVLKEKEMATEKENKDEVENEKW